MNRLVFIGLLAACGSSDDRGEVIPNRDGAPLCQAGDACEGSFSCTTATQRCTCGEHASYTFCEPLECPETTVSDGTPCTQDGLTCDPDFEFSGYRCTTPENVFVHCLGGTADSRCPATEPTIGGVCCWSPIGFDLQPCDFGANRYRCDDSGHWIAAP